MTCERCNNVDDTVEDGDLYGFIQVVLCHSCINDWQRIARIHDSCLVYEKLDAERQILQDMAKGNYNDKLIERFVDVHMKLNKQELVVLKLAREFLNDQK